MPVQLESRIVGNLPVDLSGVTVDVTRELSLSEIEQLSVRRGNRSVRLIDLFNVSGDASDGTIEIRGPLDSVERIGADMQSGKIIVQVGENKVGDHLGSQMRGGEIIVYGSVGDWVGAEMAGGLIRVSRDAGDSAAAAYRANPRGMTGGTLLIEGSAGNNVGTAMRRGLIAIAGEAGDLAGRRMLAGTILVGGQAGKRPGAGMKRGTIAILSGQPQLLPTFQQGYRGQPPALGLVMRELLRLDFPLPDAALQQEFELHHGDMLEGGRGEIFLAAS